MCIMPTLYYTISGHIKLWGFPTLRVDPLPSQMGKGQIGSTFYTESVDFPLPPPYPIMTLYGQAQCYIFTLAK